MEQRILDRLKRNYLYLLEYPVMESLVKMVVLSPLLDLAGFYEPPFRVEGETNIQIAAEDEGERIQGCIDVLVIQEQFWVTVIEAKNSEFSINTFAIFLKPLILRALSARKIKGFRKMAKVLMREKG